MDPHDLSARPLLYKVNKLRGQQMAENLTLLLSGDSKAEEGVVFPCEDATRSMKFLELRGYYFTHNGKSQSSIIVKSTKSQRWYR
jgi:hypothetical protein